MQEYFMAGMILFLGALLVWEKWQNKKREDDLITRIMANSLTDYAKNVVKISAENTSMTIEEAIQKAEADALDRVPVI